MKKILLTASVAFVTTAYGQTGNIGVNTPSPETTLDVRAKNHLGAVTATDGITAPRVNDLSTNGTINGQLVYLIADAGGFTKGFHYWNNTAWTPFGGGSGDPTNDAFVNDPTLTAVKLGTTSTGAARANNTDVVFTDNGRMGLGTTAPLAAINIISDNDAAKNDIIITNYNSGAAASDISFERSKGTLASPAPLTTGDVIFGINAKARIGTTPGAVTTTAAIQAKYRGDGITNESNLTFITTGVGSPTGVKMQLNEKAALAIGGSSAPVHDAVLDLNAHSTTPDTVTTNRGFLGPKVALSSTTMDLNTDGDANPATKPNTKGILVYNTGTGAITNPGYMWWDGLEWRSLDHSSSVSPAVATLSCANAALIPSTYTAGISYTGTLAIPYTIGNGGRYISGASTIVNGLTFKLQPSVLQSGNGDLLFSVTGTPTVSSPVATNIPINSTTVPFYTGSCTAVVGDASYAEVKQSATMGPLLATSDPAAGFHRVITSPDGKFSARVVIQAGATLDLSDIQIRSNVGTPTIMWNFSTNYVYQNGGLGVNGNNGTTFPAAGVWYGNDGANGNVFYPGITSAWGDPDVYYGSPEYRRYTWTTTDVTDPTSYTLTFMMGASTPTLSANAANAATVKAFLKIEQIKGQ